MGAALLIAACAVVACWYFGVLRDAEPWEQDQL